MSTLWLDHRNLELRIEGGALLPILGGTRQRPVPLRLLERVVILGNCRLEARTVTTLADHKISVVFLSPRKPDRRVWLIGPGHGDVTLRMIQLRAVKDDAFCLFQAGEILRAKLSRQRKVIEKMRETRPDAAHPLNRSLRIIDAIQAKLAAGPVLSMDALRGLEGAASRAGFQALGAVLPPALGFSGRRRRPPPDPVNAVLSLSYTILHHRAAQIAWAMGLEPLAGFLHEPAHGRESLAADLIEPWRPEIEHWTWRLFADRKLRKEHFSLPKEETAACVLGKAGRRIYYEALEQKLKPISRALRLQVRGLVKRLQSYEKKGGAARDFRGQ